jgi:hypothetical protein
MIKLQLLPIYIIAVILIIIIMYWIKFKISNPFWSKQPVVHKHNFFSSYSKSKIIWDDFYLPKFMNYKNIITNSWECQQEKNKIQEFISDNYYKEKNGHYSPSIERHISPYYVHDINAYISTYYLNNILIGCIFNRTLQIELRGETFSVSYIDYLCVHKGHRKKNIAPELIQTHEYFQRTKSAKKYKVSLFKKEGHLHNFTPLIKYSTMNYKLSKLAQYNYTPLPGHYEIIPVSLSLKKKLWEFLAEIKNQFDCFIIPPFETLIEMIERKSILIYGVVNKQTDTIVAMYFFRNTGLHINSAKESVECFSTMYTQLPIDVFCSAFFTLLKSQFSKNTFLHLEEIGSTKIIIDSIRKQNIYSKYNVPCAYYLYNYSNNAIDKSEKIAIIV